MPHLKKQHISESLLRQQRLSKVQGSKEKRASRISNTVSELRTQLTPQFAKSNSGVSAPLEAGCCDAVV